MTDSSYIGILSTLWFYLRVIIQVGLLASLIYVALVFMRGTRAVGILMGLVIVTIIGWFLSQLLGLEVFEYLLGQVPTLIAFALIIIFQPELRRAFAEIGSNPHLLLRPRENLEQTIDAIIEATTALSERQLGALVCVECKIGTRAYTETGVALNAKISKELLVSIFNKTTPLHDGAVIIRDGIILAANCYLPLTQGDLRQQFGTRHRAGVGLTEETDAIVVIVSEETGAISVAHTGRLIYDVDRARLRRHLTNYLTIRTRASAILETGRRFGDFYVSIRNALSRGQVAVADAEIDGHEPDDDSLASSSEAGGLSARSRDASSARIPASGAYDAEADSASAAEDDRHADDAKPAAPKAGA